MGSSLNSHWRMKVQTAGGGKLRWKAGGRVLTILLIPIEKDTGGGVEGQLEGLHKAAPAIFVRFFIESDICL